MRRKRINRDFRCRSDKIFMDIFAYIKILHNKKTVAIADFCYG